MRKRFEIQLELGARSIADVKIPTDSRDELPAILRGLQHIYCTPELNKKVFDILEEKVLSGVDKTFGRPGMNLWEILTFGSIRLGRDSDYDQLQHIANYDLLVREMIGISNFGENLKRFPLQTLKDNVSLLDDETLKQINELVAKAGQALLPNKKLNVKIDSYVLETNVHFPTDLNLLWDAGRKCIDILCHIIKDVEMDTGWRKHQDWYHRLKSSFYKASKLTSGNRKNTEQGLEAALDYLTIAADLSKKLIKTDKLINQLATSNNIVNKYQELMYFEGHLNAHIELVRRRLIYKENIPHAEKVFSLFEPHTRWIKKGKIGNKVELGLMVAVATDQYGFILGHKIMQQEQDVEIAVPFAKELVKKYDIDSISFDKGFWSRSNFIELSKLVDNVVLPKKGKLNQDEKERQSTKKFKALRKHHSAVESDINCLEHHGLNRCPDKGIENFKKYTALGILAHSLHKLGNLLLAQERQAISAKAA
jgi:IS5 family transposase